MKLFTFPLLLLCMLATFMNTNAQIKNYTKDWKTVDTNIQKGLPASALELVNKIYANAIKEKQEAQVVKALIYMTELQQENRDNNLIESIKEFENEIPKTSEPVTALLNSYLAGLYQQYFNSNRYKLYGRTNTVNFNKDDVATFTIDDFHKKITSLYLESLKNEKKLQSTSLASFDALITKGNVRYLRPSLYDLLAHRALDYFKSDERDITRPAYVFEINQPEAFSPAADFINVKFETRDSLSLQQKALLIFQDLIRFHLNGAKPDALIDVDLERLEFVNSKATIQNNGNSTDPLYILDGKVIDNMNMISPDAIQSLTVLKNDNATALYGAKAANGVVIITSKNKNHLSENSSTILEGKDLLYYKALQYISAKYGDIPAASQAKYLMAQWHQQKGLEYDANKDTTNRYELVKAKELAEEVLQRKEQSEGWVNANNLNTQLLQPYFSFITEQVNIPAAPFRVLVDFKNVDKLYFRIIPATASLKQAIQNTRTENNYWPALTKANNIRQWEQDLPHNTDLQQHATEIKIDALPIGEYFLLASANETFTSSENILAARLVYVSNISYITNNEKVFVLHRNTGQPLANAHVQVWKKVYDYNTYTYKKQKADNYTTDKNGYFQLATFTDEARKRGNNSLLFEIAYKDDKLFIEDENSYYYNDVDIDNDKEFNTTVFLFTDRSIYRPGQTVYFKGIAISKRNDGRKSVVYEDYKTTLTLYDANNEKISDIKVEGNEYGSFNGEFNLPQSGLNGQFSIRTDDGKGYTSIKMEEYKRPKFYVDFEKVIDSYKVNDTVHVTGFAKAYAGNNIDGATVKYRVQRVARFPYPWLFWRGYWPQSDNMEITHGEVETNADGKFTIGFKAIPDAALSSKSEPVFDYKIYADVIDINGETRSGENLVSAGYKSLLLKVDIADKLLTDSLDKINIRTENMAGEFQKAQVRIKFTKLLPEQRLLRDRYWKKPDQFVITKSAYVQNFPNDIYDTEDQPQTWPKSDVVLEQSSETDSSGIIKLNKTNFSSGYYSIEFTTKDKDGNDVKDIKYVELYALNQKQLAQPQYLFTSAPEAIEPGEQTAIEVSTSAPDVFLIQDIGKEKNNFSFYQINNHKKFDFTATEAERGGYGVNYLFVKNNRVFQSNNTIAVPWTNKELNIEYSSFRDKTLPGAEENWTVKITGYKKEKTAGEMLASMYDASLDQFYMHRWNKPSIWYNYYNTNRWNIQNNFKQLNAQVQNTHTPDYMPFEKTYDYLFFGFSNANIISALQGRVASLGIRNKPHNIRLRGISNQAAMDEVVVVGYGVQKKSAVTGAATSIIANEPAPSEEEAEENSENIEQPPTNNIRTNFNETAFFFPDLKTDKEGNISFSFTMPEALTRWKFQALTHTKDLAFGYSSREIVTQKELMVQPNPPRFLRQGDKMEFSSKIVNLSDKEMSGTATFQLFNAATNEVVDNLFKNENASKSFKLAPGQSQAVQFPIEIPDNYTEALTWRIVAKTSSTLGESKAGISDGEENMLPVLSNRMLVTESIPLHMRGSGTKNFKFEKLLNSNNSETLTNQSLTVEYTSNPAWYAVQALPYMMQYPYDCAEQTWNKYYANSLATLVANSSPKIKTVFEQWKTEDTAALLSNLEKNQELKSVLLEETPWVMAAKNETQQKKNIGVLFDLVRMSGELNSAYEKLKQLQSANGGFVWFKGGPDDRYITQYIVTGIGHLQKLKAVNGLQEANLNRIVQQTLPYLDLKIKEEYDNLIKYKTDLEKYTPSYYVIQYLYMRSFFSQNKIAAQSKTAVDYFTKRAKATWVQQNKYMQGMTALALHRKNDATTPIAILKSLKETAQTNEEMGMYYKDVSRSWWWYEAPIERQALLIEAFEEIANDNKTADDLKTWLLKNKQTNNWESTKATAEACYALLLQGTEWLTISPDVLIKMGNTDIHLADEKTEAGTGYFKEMIPAEKVNPEMGNINVSVKQPDVNTTLPTWGAVYWQYFEDLDKITFAETPLQLNKKLFIETNTDAGPVLNPINNGDIIHVGDKIKVRVELRVDRDMEYVHMKDMRASGFEPVNVLSSYKWQGGLGYYETTKDASTNFFFSYLRKGTYVFEYPLFATVAGNFSNGITTIQCMYAPEFTSHSEGVRVIIK